jgi:hypothetical protein
MIDFWQQDITIQIVFGKYNESQFRVLLSRENIRFNC